MAIEDDVQELRTEVDNLQTTIENVEKLVKAIYTKLIQSVGAPIGNRDTTQQDDRGLG